MNKLIGKSKLFLRRNGSTILTVVGSAGVVATAVMTAKATPKAMRLLEQAKEEKGEDLTKLEVVQVAGPAYIPAVVTGVATIVCIFGANALNKRQQAALTSAYALLDQSYKDYKKKVKEVYGEEAHEKIKQELAKDNEEKKNILVSEGNHLFYDMYSDRYFESTMAKVKTAEYEINRILNLKGYAYLNEFYVALGIDMIESGWDLGWSPGSNLDMYWQEWIDFSHTKTDMGDGTECYIIEMWQEPCLDFADYW